MITSNAKTDALLASRLEALSATNKDYWSFKGNAKREFGHGLFQYPGMMVPQVARAVLEQACHVHPGISHAADPFAGSGTILTESMLRGLSFYGTDINPLAILLCRVKSGPFFTDSLSDKIASLNARIKLDKRWAIEAQFPNRDKWFERDVQIELSKIRRAIQTESSTWARRFFWVALAETVRLTSNSRTTTFKLHIRPKEEIEARSESAIALFSKILTNNFAQYDEQTNTLAEYGYLSKGRYIYRNDIQLADLREVDTIQKADIILTSPPYGDNATTVPYGQYSYLPLQWIDLQDIDSKATGDFLSSTHEIDSRSLGGRKRLNKDEVARLCDNSSALRKCLQALKEEPSDRRTRVLAFFRDLEACLKPILSTLNKGGLMIWTLGNRRVGGYSIPLDKILMDFLDIHDATLICKLKRRIPSKRMAIKNNVSRTMCAESILVMRRAT